MWLTQCKEHKILATCEKYCIQNRSMGGLNIGLLTLLSAVWNILQNNVLAQPSYHLINLVM